MKPTNSIQAARIFLSLLLGLFYFASSLAQQVVYADLVNTDSPADHEVCMKPYSHYWNADIDDSEIILYRLEAGVDGYAELTIDDFAPSAGNQMEVKLHLINEANPTEFYTLSLINGNVSLFISSGAGSSVGTYEDGDVFRIERCLDKILFYKGETAYPNVATVSGSFDMIAKLEIMEANKWNGTAPNIVFSFPNKLATGYASIRKALDGSYALAKTNKLRFTYMEGYATSPSDQIKCQVFDSDRAIKIDVNMPNTYGVNWKTLAIPSGVLTTDEFYVLEVTGANKGEVYYLRFKY